MFENQCDQSDTHGWEINMILFIVIVTQVSLYEVKVRRDIIPFNAWNEITIIQTMFCFFVNRWSVYRDNGITKSI